MIAQSGRLETEKIHEVFMKREMIFMQIVDDFAHHPGYGTTPRDCIVMGARCPKSELDFTY